MEMWNTLAGIATRLGLKKTGEFCLGNACFYSYSVLAFACVFDDACLCLGLKRLRHEVRTCEYEDIRVLWDMLNKAEAEIARSSAEAEAAAANKGEKRRKRKNPCSFFEWVYRRI